MASRTECNTNANACTTIEQFARLYRLKWRRDVDGTEIIPGRLQDSHIFQYDEERFGVIFCARGSNQLPRSYWLRAQRALQPLGGVRGQCGDNEGVILFDPANHALAQAAIKWAKIRRRRVLSEKQKAVLALAYARSPIGKRKAIFA